MGQRVGKRRLGVRAPVPLRDCVHTAKLKRGRRCLSQGLAGCGPQDHNLINTNRS